jgi:hypothetical protein
MAILMGAAAGVVQAADDIRVDVYTLQDDWVASTRTSLAKHYASELFEKIGVRLVWHSGKPRAQSGDGHVEIGMRLVGRAPCELPPGVMGFAFPYRKAKKEVVLYQDRVLHLTKRYAALADLALGYVLAHELAHVMQGIDRHSDSGVMKSHWSPGDLATMCGLRAGFDDADAGLIRNGLRGRTATHPQNPVT